ncbi:MULTISPECIES: helix-turn-helix domain-containing protein [Vibrio]|uniref:helix-turn-helix domain-containing protein n=1 Tax=Vibrio TaxID=662 RepID=UPI00078D9541|nr:MULTISPECIES: helix-turn-helix domain-containing protein [Vibrio]BAU70861.1 hypothetical protein [Vibrio sp. 04Ya108]BBM67570.1 hypothetical protein VA249_42160 [Vibrio alfacsensis]BCN27053.1 hypothetical protein VYA_42450 [Vibrio alfacsensis]
MFSALRIECKINIKRMWFLSQWDKEDLMQHMELCILVASEELQRNAEFKEEHVKLFTIREVNNLASRLRKHSNTICSNTIDDDNWFVEETSGYETSVLTSVHQALVQIKNNCRGDTKKLDALGMHLEGYTVREIAEKLSLSKTTANRIINQCSL